MTAFSPSAAQSGCPDCSASLPAGLPDDTLFLSAAPNGTAGAYYEADVGFRMPLSTTPVHASDPNTPPGLPIGNITILALANVPPGLQWQPNQFSFDPGVQPDGCVRFCGTPLQPGLYEVQVFVSAQVLVTNQTTSFTFLMLIQPALATNDGFSMTNGTGCGSVIVDFQNNVSSNGQPGFSYTWDFGNGNVSDEEHPDPQTYGQPGQYPVRFQAVIDTFGYQLTTVTILDAACNDFGLPTSVPPDLYIKIKDPNGNLLVSTVPADNVSFPFAASINLPLDTGVYELEVRDEDLFGSESCGYVYFDRQVTDTLVSGGLTVLPAVIHPVAALETTDTVTVFPLPPVPQLEPDGQTSFCEGSQTTLSVENLIHGLQWFVDTSALLGADTNILPISQPGAYYVVHTDSNGCISQSDLLFADILPLPYPPAFQNEGNLLVLNDPALLPSSHTLQWSLDGTPLPDATGESWCNTVPGTSLYTLTVTDLGTGCSRSFSLGTTFDSGVSCATSFPDANNPGSLFRLMENPVGQTLRLVVKDAASPSLRYRLVDATGRPLTPFLFLDLPAPTDVLTLDMHAYPAGYYLLQLIPAEGIPLTLKIAKSP
ncbi:MAG: hypothetical protein RLY31_2495 [Bacteroidota bacterium]|jgi:hypothetical protein